jgi:acyl-CoA synthetase (AMP-forming)/AMP-acid ligase II
VLDARVFLIITDRKDIIITAAEHLIEEVEDVLARHPAVSRWPS